MVEKLDINKITKLENIFFRKNIEAFTCSKYETTLQN